MTKPAKGPVVERTIYIQATPARVWKALTRGAELARWYTTPHKLELRKGGRWEFLEGRMAGKVLDAARPAKLAVSLRFIDNEPAGRVTFLVEPLKAKGGPRVQLKVIHDRLAAAPITFRCWSGDGAWTWILCNLKTYVETGRPMSERAFY